MATRKWGRTNKNPHLTTSIKVVTLYCLIERKLQLGKSCQLFQIFWTCNVASQDCDPPIYALKLIVKSKSGILESQNTSSMYCKIKRPAPPKHLFFCKLRYIWSNMGNLSLIIFRKIYFWFWVLLKCISFLLLQKLETSWWLVASKKIAWESLNNF